MVFVYLVILGRIREAGTSVVGTWAMVMATSAVPESNVFGLHVAFRGLKQMLVTNAPSTSPQPRTELKKILERRQRNAWRGRRGRGMRRLAAIVVGVSASATFHRQLHSLSARHDLSTCHGPHRLPRHRSP